MLRPLEVETRNARAFIAPRTFESMLPLYRHLALREIPVFFITKRRTTKTRGQSIANVISDDTVVIGNPASQA